jgi:hypothetical protein
MPLLTITEIDNLAVTLTTPPIYSHLIKGPITLTFSRDEIAQRRPMHSDVQMKAQASFCISWKDVSMPRIPVETTLENVIETVAYVIPRFDGFV